MTHEFLTGPQANGLYLAPEETDRSRDATAAAGLHWREVNLARVTKKQEFLAACARGLRFPRSFGANWDALADCLKDLCGDSVIDCRNCGPFARAAPGDFATALEVFQDAAGFWRERGRAFIVLVDAEPEGAQLPRMSAPGDGR